MPVAAVSVYQHWGGSAPFSVLSKRRKAQKLSGFRAKSTYWHCIKDSVLIDPACGSGNFLTETYLSLRRIENKIIDKRTRHMPVLNWNDGANDIIEVSIQQFYGIEINDFAVAVAQTALWIAEHKTFKETERILNMDVDFLPLKTFTHIHEGNALTMDWNDVIPADNLTYIMGNPPFVSKTGRVSRQQSSSVRILSETQKKEKEMLLGPNSGVLDYVCCWFKKAAEYIRYTNVRASLVSTSSICQGQQTSLIWRQLLDLDIQIDFCWKQFKWGSETIGNKKATVFVVIIGFSYKHKAKYAKIYDTDGTAVNVKHINPYLFEGPDILIETRKEPLCDVPSIAMGNQPIDHGLYIFNHDEMKNFIAKEPASEAYFRPWYTGDDFLSRRPEYILWLGECSPSQIKAMPECYKLVKAVREFRLKSSRASTRRLAEKPTHFQTENMPKGTYIVIPEVSSGDRDYIPMGFMDERSLCSNKIRLMPGADLYHFGVLESSVHTAWADLIGGHYGPSYQYSINVVYNNFPWPKADSKSIGRITKTAQAILDARDMYPSDSLATLYDRNLMPFELRKAHEENDKAVMDAYGFDHSMSTTQIVSELMKMYQKLVEQENAK